MVSFTIQRMICSDRKDNSLLRLLDSPLLIYIATSFLCNNRAEKTTHLFTSCLSLLSLYSQSQPFQHSTMCIAWWTGLGYLEKNWVLVKLRCIVASPTLVLGVCSTIRELSHVEGMYRDYYVHNETTDTHLVKKISNPHQLII